jgi:hypothetical protein
MVKKNEVNNKKKVTKAIVIAALSLGVVGAAFAYFSAIADTKHNAFSVFTGAKDNTDEATGITILEPTWKAPEKAVQSGTVLAKDPSVKSNASYDGYVVMKVSIPIVNGKLEGATANEDVPIAKLGTINTDKFVLIGEPKVVEDAEGKKKQVMYYGYKEVLPAGKESAKLFTDFQIQKFDSLLNGTESTIGGYVDVDARMIQAIDETTGTDYANNGKGGVADAYAELMKEGNGF